MFVIIILLSKVEVLHDGGNIRFAVSDAASQDPAQSALDANLLVFARTGQKQMDLTHVSARRSGKNYTFDLVLPPNLTCEHCLFQVR